MKIKDKVLIVEDEQSISNFISMVLNASGYDTIIVGSGEEALTMIASHCPDLIVLDLGLPDMDGMEVLKSVRKWSNLPVVVVSARNHEHDKVDALDYGADDYLVKPFGTSELLARIRTAIRHTRTTLANSQIAQSGKFTAGDLTIDYDKHQVLIRGENAKLTVNEYKIVALLGKYAGKVLTYDFIIPGAVGPQGQGRQPDPPGEHGQYPPQDRGHPRPAPVHLHRGGRGLPHAGGRLRPSTSGGRLARYVKFSPQICKIGAIFFRMYMVQSEYPKCMRYNMVPEKVGLILWNTMRSWTASCP